MTDVVETGRLRGLLRDAFPPPDWVLAFEVLADYGDGIRYADAMAFDLKRHRGHALHGFELKVSRGDLLHEVKQPDKHKPAAHLVDYWWLVLGSEGLLKDPWQVPSNWGIMAPDPRTGALGIVRHPARNTSRNGGPGLDQGVMAGILRRFVSEDYSPEAYWRDQVRRAEQRGIAKGRNMAGRTARARVRKGEDDPKAPLDLP